MQTRIVAGTFMLAWASLFAFIGVFAFVRRYRRQVKGCAATGTVVGNEEHRHSKGTTYRPQVEFQTADGQRITFVASFSSSRRTTPGRKMRVLYYSGDPEDAAVLSFADVWIVPLLLMLLATGFLAMSSMFYAGILENQPSYE